MNIICAANVPCCPTNELKLMETAPEDHLILKLSC